MQNKYAYSCSISKDKYIPYIILNKRIMDYLGCKYPLVVLVTDEVSKEGIKEMEDFNIIVKEIPKLKLMHNHDFALNFSSLLLEEYELIFTFEADIILLDNYDYLFNLINDTSKKDKNLILFPRPAEGNLSNCPIFIEPESAFFFCRPSKEE